MSCLICSEGSLEQLVWSGFGFLGLEAGLVIEVLVVKVVGLAQEAEVLAEDQPAPELAEQVELSELVVQAELAGLVGLAGLADSELALESPGSVVQVVGFEILALHSVRLPPEILEHSQVV